MKKSFWVPLAALIGSMMFSVTVLAGDINSAEQKVIDAISGTYEYNGAYYKVTDAYIAKVIDYLNRDDIDMSEYEADSYIRQFGANISVGISSGYMVEVDNSGSSDEENGSGGKNNNNNNNSNSNNNNSNNSNSTNNNSDGAGTTDGVNNDNNSDNNTDTDINSDNPLAGILPQSDSETGEIEDNTLGSTLDGEVDYTVFPIESQTMYVWDVDTLDVHAEAYKDSEVIGTLNKGDAVTILGAATTGWAQIEYDDTVGYVSAVYLRTQGYMNTMQDENDEGDSEETDTDEDSVAADSDEADGSEDEPVVKDYSDAAPLAKSLNLGLIALVIVIVAAVGAGGVIFWHRNKIRKR